MSKSNTLPERVAAELRAEMARQRKSIHELSIVLGLGYRAAQSRHSGLRELSLDELAKVSEWLDMPINRFTTPPDQKRAA